MTDFEKAIRELSPKQQELLQKLNDGGQSHLFQNFHQASLETRKALASQLEVLDGSYPTGILGYTTRAKELLEDSRNGVNPLDGWTPSVPKGEAFELGTPEYQETEAIGMQELGSIGFVLVAGGLGERLGYTGIKIALPTETASMTCYLQYYITYILSLERKYSNGNTLPLCIMTSNDTNDRTVKLLEANAYFGMKKEQITIVQQGQGVPALTDNDATIAMDPDEPVKVLTKPHGHGDIHELLYRHRVAKNWIDRGIKWLILFQDTNGLAFHTLPLMLGVSKKMDLIMNSLAVPRKAKQAIGGIAKLENQETGETRTINVEYNQLDPLLRATGNPNGDVNDDETGYSPFPGNINQLLFQLDGYHKALERTKGMMPEFVNPKYKDETKTVFKKPTRLECMMQDFPTVLEGEDTKKVGYTSVPSDLCFSPVKNATSDGVALQAQGIAPGTAATGERDQYGAFRKMLRSIGCQVEQGDMESHLGVEVDLLPAIVLDPSFLTCPGDLAKRFPHPGKVKISKRSTLIVRGEGVVIESLDLDGAMIIDGRSGEQITINKEVKNDGWAFEKDEASDDEIIKMRGYHIERKDTDQGL